MVDFAIASAVTGDQRRPGRSAPERTYQIVDTDDRREQLATIAHAQRRPRHSPRLSSVRDTGREFRATADNHLARPRR